MRSPFSFGLVRWFAWVCLLSPALVRADDGEGARAAFERGMTAVEQGDFATAADAFEAALAQQPTPSVEYNLAAALFELGHYGQAQEHLDHVLAARPSSADVRASARDLQKRLQARVSRLSVRVSLEGGHEARLYLDGEELPEEQWGTPHAVDAGTHYVRVVDDTGRATERQVTVAPGGEATLDLHLVALGSSPTAARPAPAGLRADQGAEERDEPQPSPGRWKVWVGVSAALVVSAVAVGVGLAMRDPSAESPAPTQGSLAPGALVW